MKRNSLLLLAVICAGLMGGCQSNEVENSSSPEATTTATMTNEETVSQEELEPVRTVTTIDLEAVVGAFQQVSDTSQYTMTEEQTDTVFKITGVDDSTWTLYAYPEVDEASAQFDELAGTFEERKKDRKDLTYEATGEAPERSVGMFSEKKNYIYQIIQQDNIVLALEGKGDNQEVLYALTTEYFYAISPYLPSSLAADDDSYMPEQNELIAVVGQGLQSVIDELNLPAIRRENTYSDLMGEEKNVTLLTENQNFALRVSIFATEEAAQKDAEQTNEFYNEYGIESEIKEDAFGKRYIFADLGTGEYHEVIVDGQTVITALELSGDREYTENAIAIYVDAKAKLATESSAN